MSLRQEFPILEDKRYLYTVVVNQERNHIKNGMEVYPFIEGIRSVAPDTCLEVFDSKGNCCGKTY